MNQQIRYQNVFQQQESAHRLELLISPKRVRVVFAGEVLADSRAVRLLRESGRPPVYYFPREDVRRGLLVSTGHVTRCPHKGKASYWTIKAGGRLCENAVWSFTEPGPEAPDLSGCLGFEWDRMDAWFEEDEEVFVHPRDPYTRIDALHSSRHVRVVIDGEVVAESRRPVLLFETGLRTRYYLPKMDVDQGLLLPSERRTYCPYKGEAGYYSLQIGDVVHADIAWYYAYPTLESAPIAGMIAFYDERVEAFYVDGELLPKGDGADKA
jgi:uncharacterized protein (DUF427 family)